MSVFLPDYTFSGTVAASSTTLPTIDCQGFSSGQLFVYSNSDFHVDQLWSADKGVNVDLIDLSGVQASGTTYSASITIKARYFALRIAEDVAVGGSTYRYSCYLNANAPIPDPFTLTNIGTGAYWYKPEGEMKSVYSSDGSMNIVVYDNELDLQANWPILSGVLQTDNKTEGYDIDMTMGSCLKTTSGDMCVSVNSGTGNLNLDGNLVVTGDITSVDINTLSVADSSILLNSGYTTTAGKSAFVVNNYLPTANTALVNGNITPGVPATSNPTIVTNNGYAFIAGDIVQTTGCNLEENDGLYEVHSYSNPTLTLRGVGLNANTFSFFSSNVTTDSVVAGTLTLMTISALRNNTSGVWEFSNTTSNTSSLTFTSMVHPTPVIPYPAQESIFLRTNTGTIANNGTVLLAQITSSGHMTVASGVVNLPTVGRYCVSIAWGWTVDGTIGISINGADKGNNYACSVDEGHNSAYTSVLLTPSANSKLRVINRSGGNRTLHREETNSPGCSVAIVRVS